MATQQSVAMKVDRKNLPPFDRESISAAEWQVRVDLAATYRLVALYGWDDLVFTHISARVPGPEHHFLINPYGLGFDEITASSLVKIDLEGRPQHSTPHYVNAAGFTIHSAMHIHSPDANCVIHTHSPDGAAVAAQDHGLLPVSQNAMVLWGDIAYHDYEGVALDHSERERLVEDMGDKHCMILRNHGLLTMGKSCADAFMRLYYLERACTYQVKALSAGVEHLNLPNQGVPEHTAGMVQWSFDGGTAKIGWPALLRKLDRANPGYAD
ncbi:class II aldolase/adducin family protein [Iodidimonas sp. SYSU 1G8]|uniref:class II aldolase/adducin family protein n=1 Tax=Iodidimonas sp. SYSU 1G8 TaxID=3133967 RepID=UPI0031FE8AB7